MADIDPPSFSLGLDFDIEPRQSQLQPQPSTQTDAPSFSLGLDLDFQPTKPPLQPVSSTPNDIAESPWFVPDSDIESPENLPPSRLRHLRCSVPRFSTPIPISVEDDIEDFSDEDDVRADHSRVSQHQTLCSSSKLPLSGSGVLTRPQDTVINDTNSKRKEELSAPPTSVASNKGKSVITDFNSSPLRRFVLLDSDSDDPTEGAQVKGNAGKANSSKNVMQNESNHDLWKDFCVDHNVSVPTPVFDELLEEYYMGGKQSKPVSGSHDVGSNGMGSRTNDTMKFAGTETSETIHLPCHQYFFHDDNRIQRLVRSRLPYFCPLIVSGDTGNMPYNASYIDYRSQFGNGDGATANPRAYRNLNVDKSSRRPSRRKKKANVEQDSQGTGAWIDPKQTTNKPKDAGKRRVRADDQSSGHWTTGDGGTKVYVTRTGKKLTGRLAYINYKKENGGFKKPTKKRKSKKKC